MTNGAFTSLRRWCAALGLAAATTLPTLTIPTEAAPIVPPGGLSVPAGDNAIVAVRDRHFYGRHGGYYGRHYGGYDRGRYYRHRHYGHHDRGVGLALGLGLGVPLGAAIASQPYYGYDGYDGYYGGGYYDRPYVVRRVPRPVYRSYHYGNAHVEWCYGRYRSYRAYDNTFQPNYGPRRECISPYG